MGLKTYGSKKPSLPLSSPKSYFANPTDSKHDRYSYYNDRLEQELIKLKQDIGILTPDLTKPDNLQPSKITHRRRTKSKSVERDKVKLPIIEKHSKVQCGSKCREQQKCYSCNFNLSSFNLEEKRKNVKSKTKTVIKSSQNHSHVGRSHGSGQSAVNVYVTNMNLDFYGRQEILNFVNDYLECNFTNIEDMKCGSPYLQFMDMLFPGSIPMKKVKFQATTPNECIHNFEILQIAFNKLQVDKEIPIDKLVKGRFLDNFEFLQWFKKFFIANHKGGIYNAVEARGGVPFGGQMDWRSLNNPHSNKRFSIERQRPNQEHFDDPVVSSSHRQSCRRGWYYRL